jgi:hypothetical protein
MQLVVFDLDTALCRANTMDSLAMASAIKDVADCQIEPESIDSIHDLKSLWYKATRRVADVHELSDLKDRFSFHLRRQFLIRPSIINANYPMVQQVNYIQNQQQKVVGLISSSSHSVLLLKARAIGLMCDSLPVATGDDSDSLEGILETIQTRVKRSFGFNRGKVDLVADSIWRDSAKRANMNHILPSNYLEKSTPSKPMSQKIFSRTISHFSLT